MRAIAAGVTDVGRERDHNEDRFMLLPEFEVFVVADGMGGHQCGEVASRMATSTIATYFRAHREARREGTMSEVLRCSLEQANERIHRRANMSTRHRGMGTTVVAAAFNRRDKRIHVAHAGDSRAYRLREGAFTQLTRDHSLVEEALRTRPDISKSELAYLPANVITRALGVEATVDADVIAQDVELGDIFLLCSDGLHGYVSDERIAEIVMSLPVLTSACIELVAEANRNGGGDNITAVLIRIEEVDDPWAVSTSVPPAPAKALPEVKISPSRRVPDIATLEDDDEDDIHERDTLVASLATPEAQTQLARSELPADEARAEFEAEDTAQLRAITDADLVLAAHAGASASSVDDTDSELEQTQPADETLAVEETPPADEEPSADDD